MKASFRRSELGAAARKAESRGRGLGEILSKVGEETMLARVAARQG
jgi:hypothetical protein